VPAGLGFHRVRRGRGAPDRVYIVATECDIAQANPFEFPLMCRSIRTLFNFEPPVTEAEVRAASLQFVRKVTGFNKPSKANEAAFDAAVESIAAASARLLGALETSAPPKYREIEAAKARARAGLGRRGSS
jgi:hypothetical protein